MKPALKLFLCIAAITLTACNKATPIDEIEGFDYGRVRNDKYVNNYFNFEMNVPKGWAIQDDAQRDQVVKQGTEEVFKDNDNMKNAVKASHITTANLFMAFEKKPGTVVGYNPNLIIIAENVTAFPYIKSGDIYLANANKLLHSSKIDIGQIDNSYPKKTINGTDFYEMNVIAHVQGMDIHQTYLARVDKGFAICLISGYADDIQKAKLEKYTNSFTALKK